MSFYATLFRESLSAESLEILLKGASTLHATLSMAGVTIVEVFRSNEFTSVPANSQAVILIWSAIGSWRWCDTDWGTDLSDYCWVCDLVEKSQPLCIVRYCMSIVLQVTVLQESEAEKSLPTRIEATANK